MQETHPDESIVDGQIVAYIEEDGEDVALWKNRHDEDGALEDLEAHELERALGAFNRKLRAPKDGCFDDEEEDKVGEAATEVEEDGEREKKRMRGDGGAMGEDEAGRGRG